MKRVSLKKLLVFVMVVAVLSLAFVGCGNTPAPSSQSSSPPASTAPASSAPASSAPPAEKTKITFWYLWGGDSVGRIDGLVSAYNAKSDKYTVEALSVPDSQKIMTAISAGNGPDVTDDFASNIGKYATAGIMEPLDSYVTKTNYDIKDFIPASIQGCSMDGTLYALPCNMTTMALFYNKTLLKDAGYNDPPKTLEEMYDMAVKTTKVNADGTLDVCGFPDFPNVYYMGSVAAAAGGGMYTEDGKPAAADNYGNKLALQLEVDYRTKFGLDNVVKFASGGKYLDPTDPFLMGKQTFRIDGPWMGRAMKETFKSTVDYGVTFVPYPKDKPELAGRAVASTSILYIPANSKNKDGAFDFLGYFVGTDGQVAFTLKQGDFPSRLSVLSNADFLKGYDVDFFSQLAQSKNLTYTPSGPKNGEYDTIASDEIEKCMNLEQDIDTTLKNINQQGSDLFK